MSEANSVARPASQKSAPTHGLTIRRESVCAGDDVAAPHEVQLSDGGRSFTSVANQLAGMRYLASIQGGRATWVLNVAPRPYRPVGVFAQQWDEPRWLIDPETPVRDLVRATPPGPPSPERPHLHWQYFAQTDPDDVFARLSHGETLDTFRESRSDLPGGPR